MSFVELAARTHFSLLRGGSSPKALLQRAAELGYDALGVADCDGLYGMVRALEAAEEVGRAPRGRQRGGDRRARGPGRVWLHVASIEGYRNLCRILTESHARHPKGQARKPESLVARNQFAGIPVDRVCALSGGLWCLCPPDGMNNAAMLAEAFGERLSVLAWRHLDGEDGARLARTEAVARALGAAVCATNRVLYAGRRDKPVFDVLHCIREGITLDDAGRALLAEYRGPPQVEG